LGIVSLLEQDLQREKGLAQQGHELPSWHTAEPEKLYKVLRGILACAAHQMELEEGVEYRETNSYHCL
jgi:hypothetical protein